MFYLHAMTKKLPNDLRRHMKFFHFLFSCIRLRSISRARWVAYYDRAEVKK